MSKPIPQTFPPYRIVNFKETDDKEDSFVRLRIEEGKFEGIEFHFQELKVLEEDAEGGANLNYTYNVIKGEIAPEDTEDFEEATAGILLDLIEYALDTVSDELDDDK